MELLPIDVSPFFMKRLEELVDKQLGNTYAEPFWLPVDWKAMKLLDYPKIITYPMDLTTIKTNIQRNVYTNIHDIIFDLNAIWAACFRYNRKDLEIYKMGESLRDSCLIEIDKIYNEYYQQNIEKCNMLKEQIKLLMKQQDPKQYSLMLSWLQEHGLMDKGLIVNLDTIHARDFDELIRYFGLSWWIVCFIYSILILTFLFIRSISKWAAYRRRIQVPYVNKEVHASLLTSESHTDPEPHPVQKYVVSSSEESSCTAPIERKNSGHFVNAVVNQVVQDLIDVPSLAYTLYGSNSPYNYCIEYNNIITSVRIVDGVLNVSIEPELDSSYSVEELLTKPSSVDISKINQCGEELESIVESMKVKDESLVVEF